MKAEIYSALTSALAEERLVALATVVAGPGLGGQLLLWPDGRRLGSLGDAAPADAVVSWGAERLADHRNERRTFGTGEAASEVFVEVHPPPPQLILVGAVHTAIPLITFANTLGYRTIVVDPRGAFATPERFAHADRLVREWPEEAFARLSLNESTAVALLSHDLKIDLPALRIVLRRPVRYIGALGSSRTHAKRAAALAEEGFSEAEIGRIHAPIGLDLGGRRPEEIAVSVIAEIVAVTHGRR